MARLSPRMGILFRFFTVAYGGQQTFRNKRRVDGGVVVVRGGATAHSSMSVRSAASAEFGAPSPGVASMCAPRSAGKTGTTSRELMQTEVGRLYHGWYIPTVGGRNPCERAARAQRMQRPEGANYGA